MARVEGNENKDSISSPAKFLAGGIAGVISQFAVYPIDTLKL